MWFAALAHAAFEADLADVGWNYLRQLLDELPESLQMYEHNQDVTGEDGVTRHVTLNLFGFSYLPHAVIRGFAGFGYDEKAHHYFFRPQAPDELGTVRSHIRIGSASFDVTSSGNGKQVAEFKIDGVAQPCYGVLDSRYVDGAPCGRDQHAKVKVSGLARIKKRVSRNSFRNRLEILREGLVEDDDVG